MGGQARTGPEDTEIRTSKNMNHDSSTQLTKGRCAFHPHYGFGRPCISAPAKARLHSCLDGRIGEMGGEADLAGRGHPKQRRKLDLLIERSVRAIPFLQGTGTRALCGSVVVHGGSARRTGIRSCRTGTRNSEDHHRAHRQTAATVRPDRRKTWISAHFQAFARLCLYA